MQSFLSMRRIESKAQEGKRLAVEILPILGKPAASIEPSNGAFDNPALRHEFEAGHRIRSFDNFNIEVRKRFGERGGELRTLIAAIGEELLQEGKQPEQRCHDQNAAVAILDVGRMNNSMEQEA